MPWAMEILFTIMQLVEPTLIHSFIHPIPFNEAQKYWRNKNKILQLYVVAVYDYYDDKLSRSVVLDIALQPALLLVNWEVLRRWLYVISPLIDDVDDGMVTTSLALARLFSSLRHMLMMTI